MKKLTNTCLAMGLTLAATVPAQAGFKTGIKPYLKATPEGDYTIEAILSVGDKIPWTGDETKEYQMPGLPDGMGIYKDPETGDGVLIVNHEITSGSFSQPVVGEDRYVGSLVSKIILDPTDGSVKSAALAYDRLFVSHYSVGSPGRADENGIQRGNNGFTRFCSGYYAGTEHGFDRPLYFTNEESSSGTFDDIQGAQAVVVADGRLHTLPALGYVARENTVPQPRQDMNTVILSTEDRGYPSYLYMFVGVKDPVSRRVLTKNGLDEGTIYVLGSNDPAQNTATTFRKGSVSARWIEVPNGEELTHNELKAWAGENGGFQFVRLEDVEFRKDNPNEAYFVATGGSGPADANQMGRMYRLTLNDDPTKDAQLDIVYNADSLEAADGSFQPQLFFNAMSPDNLGINNRYVMVQEDRNGTIQSMLNIIGRDGSIFSYDLQNGMAAKREAELNQPNRFGITQNLGRWESSGITDASSVFGANTWIVNVQAHGGIPSEETEFRFITPEDGQILIMRPKS